MPPDPAPPQRPAGHGSPEEARFTRFHDTFVRGLAHKLNNILSLFHGYLSILDEDPRLAPDIRAHLDRLREASAAATDLVERIRAFARPDSLLLRQLDPAAFLHDLRPLLDDAAGSGAVTIDCPDRLPAVQADPARLRAALAELVRNAREHGGPAASIAVAAREAAAPQRHLPRAIVFSVTDDGPGIPEALLSRVAEPFFSTRTHAGSTGLGIPVAIGLAEQMGGSLRFASAPGKTAFEILLPAAPPTLQP
jgi:signal transduction histidine kinase